MQISDLSKPFPRAAVHWRVQGQPYERNGTFFALALAYIDARDVMDRLDEVCGPANWQTEYTETAAGRVICRLGIRLDGEWVWKSDGAGGTAVEAEKGGVSDALKRAAVAWGIGRYLYRLDAPWVPCEVNQKNGKTYWKKWAVDPWQKVKGAPAQPPQEGAGQEKGQADKPPMTDQQKRDWLKNKLMTFKTKQQALDWWQSVGKDKSDKLPKPMALEVEALFNDRHRNLPDDPARQAA